MKVLCAILLVAVVYSTPSPKFKSWMKHHGKVYANEAAMAHAFSNFKASEERIAKLNAVHDNTAAYGLTKFADLSSEEFKAQYLMSNFEGTPDEERDVLEFQSFEALPDTFDWRADKRNVISPVKNQGQCGSCWAFSTTENIESMWAMNHSMQILAPQQIVSCDKEDDGCNGGDPPTAYQYVIKAGGMETEADYPYIARDGSCRFEAGKVVTKISSWKYITKTGDEDAMQQGLFAVGPLSICVDASTWQDYNGGIISHSCGTKLDHCVQLVGWNSQSSGSEYWIVRNSWGKDWGLDGYLYVEKGKDLCGIAKEATCSVV